MTFINQYSILWSSLIVLGLAAYLVLRRGFSLQRSLVVIVIGGLLLASWFFIRPQQANTTDLGQFQAELGSGQAVLLELQSPY
jgi:Flp pilus assembly protein TadB